MVSAKKILKIDDKYILKSLKLLAFLSVPILSGLLSLYLGMDINWDVKNYHYYNAYAFLEHRMDVDIAPAQLQTYFNPLSDLPFYWMINHFPAWVAGFVLGAVHGINLSLILSIFWKIFKHADAWLTLVLGMCLVMVSGLAPGFISELGNTMNDNLMSLFVLSAISLLISTFRPGAGEIRPLGLLHICLAGLVMGLGVGLKPTIAFLAIGSAIALIALQTAWRERVLIFIVYGITGIIGGIITGGFWWWRMWERFGNPFFPLYNNIFKSTYFTAGLVDWSTFLPSSLWEYVAWPFIFTLNSYRVNQIYFFDIRFVLLYVAAIAWLIVFLLKKNHWSVWKDSDNSRLAFDFKPGNFLLLFFLASYVLWLINWSVYRFAIALELLVPLCFLILLERLVQSEKIRTLLIVGAVFLTFIVFKPFDWGRLAWDGAYFHLETSQLNDSGDPVVIMLGSSPISYLIPQFPPNYRFVRPEGNLLMGDCAYLNSSEKNFPSEIKKMLKQHNGSLYILYNDLEKQDNIEKKMANLGLEVKVDSCFLLQTNMPDNMHFCRLSRTR